jgi:hypothetical protein
MVAKKQSFHPSSSFASTVAFMSKNHKSKRGRGGAAVALPPYRTMIERSARRRWASVLVASIGLLGGLLVGAISARSAVMAAGMILSFALAADTLDL